MNSSSITITHRLVTSAPRASRQSHQLALKASGAALNPTKIYSISQTMSTRRSARINAVGSTKNVAAVSSNPLQSTSAKPSSGDRKRKSKLDIDNGASPGGSLTPLTPKRKKSSQSVALPVTPTPALISLMVAPPKPQIRTPSPQKTRLAVPDESNATLVTPETRRVVSQKPVDQVSPSKAGSLKTTENILEVAVAHLVETDPRLEPIIKKWPCRVFSPEGLAEKVEPFESLISGIISQQVSGAAAKSIKAKFISLFNADKDDASSHVFPAPSQVSTSSIETLRTAGLSQRKAEYCHGLAEKFVSGEITTSFLLSASYEEILEELIKVRGLGQWSIEMFACFALKRLDIFSTGDLGVQRGMAALEGRNVAKMKTSKAGKWKYMSEKEMQEISEKFQPYRSLFMWYMWRVEETDVSTME